MYRIAIGGAVVLTVAAVIWYQHDAIKTLRTSLDRCDQALAPLRAEAKRAKVLEVENNSARAAAAATASTHAQRADKELSTPASNSDSCIAAQDRASRWLQERAR